MRKETFKLLWIEVKVAVSAARWVFPLFVLGGLILLTNMQAEVEERQLYIATLTEVVFPLGAMFLANDLILREREEETLSFVAVRSRLPWIWLRRLGLLLLIEILCMGVLLLVYRVVYIEISIAEMLFGGLAVSLVLIGLSSFVSLLLKEMNAGYLFGVLWWGMCLIGRGASFRIFGPRLYLFYAWFSVLEEYPPEAWLENKLTLAAAGLTLILASAFSLRRTERLIT